MEGMNINNHINPNYVPRQPLPTFKKKQSEGDPSQSQSVYHPSTNINSPHNPFRLPMPSTQHHQNPPYNAHQPRAHPLAPSAHGNRPNMAHSQQKEVEFGSSLASRPSKSSSSSQFNSSSAMNNSYIKPATPGAFNKAIPRPAQNFSKPSQPAFHIKNARPIPVRDGQLNPDLPVPTVGPSLGPRHPAPGGEGEDDGEVFDLRNAGITQADMMERDADAEKHMRELLSNAIGDDDAEDIKERDNIVEGFADNMRLLPHQVRGLRFMRKRETGRCYGGILADDMGLGKTVQALANIITGVATAAEKKKGHRSTLIVAPLAVMNQWATEAKTKTQPGLLKVITHHSSSRTKSVKELEKYDIVITTFSTLASEHAAYEKSTSNKKAVDNYSDSEDSGKKKAKPKKVHQALFEMNWLRVVIDEAQGIKNKNTKAAKAAVALRSKYRWCLTGTPIQNGVEELYSLFLFLRLRPMSNWNHFKQNIVIPVREGRTKAALKRLHVLLKAVMLRRTKNTEIDGKKILTLPDRTVEVVKCTFSTEERAFYTALEAKMKNKLDQEMDKANSYISVLTLLLRLRQACSHPSLVTRSIDVDIDEVESKPAEEDDDADGLADLLGGLGVDKRPTCQLCFKKLEAHEEKHCLDCLKEIDAANDLPARSAKIREMLRLLRVIRSQENGVQKTIVFSQFTSFLDLVEPFLKQEEIAFVRYDGSMRADKRQESIEAINNDPKVKIILISFKAGSTGLNLTACNNVILMDLWWNPALEDQAFDRAHRLGQKRNVNIYKLTIEDTVEDRILTLQGVKRELAEAALSGKGAMNMKLTMDDLLKLFRSNRPRHGDDEEDDDDDDDGDYKK